LVIARGITMLLALLLFGQSLLLAAQEAPEWDAGLSKEAAQSAAGKFRQIQESAETDRPFGRIQLSEQEVNSYFHYEMASLFPPGVSKIRMEFQPNRPIGFVLVDFDKVRESLKTPPNPLVSYFLQGVHTVGVEGTLVASNGTGRFHLEVVTLDGITLPQFVVDFLIEQFVKAHYPSVDLDRPFRLPFSIDQVRVEAGKIVLVGRADAL